MYFLRNLLSKIHKPVLKSAPNIPPNNDIVEANIPNSADNENKVVQNRAEINNPKDKILVNTNIDIIPNTDILNKNINDSENVNETVGISNSHEQLFNNTDVSFSNIKNEQDYKIHNSSDCTSSSNNKDKLNGYNSYEKNTCSSVNLNEQFFTKNSSTIMYSKYSNQGTDSHNLKHIQVNEHTNKIFSNAKTSNSDSDGDLKKLKTDVANITEVTQNNSVEAADSSTICSNSLNVAIAIEAKSTEYSDNSNDKNDLRNHTLKNVNTEITDKTNSSDSLLITNSVIAHSDFIIDSHLKKESDNATIGCLNEFEDALTKVENQNYTPNFAYDHELNLEDNEEISDENTEGDDTYSFQEITYFSTEMMAVNTLSNFQIMRKTKNQREALDNQIRLEDNDIICLSSDDDMDGQDPKESIQCTKNTENTPLQYSGKNLLNNPLIDKQLTYKQSALTNSELVDQTLNTLSTKRTKETNNETIFKEKTDENSLSSNDPTHKYDQGSKEVFDTTKNDKFEMKILDVSTSNDATNIKVSTNLIEITKTKEDIIMQKVIEENINIKDTFENITKNKEEIIFPKPVKDKMNIKCPITLKEITNSDDTVISKPSEKTLNTKDTTTLDEITKDEGDIIILKLLIENVCTNDSNNLKEITHTKHFMIRKQLEENFIDAYKDIQSTNSDTDSDYHSSDFEFITEEEAKLDGFIINFHPKMQVQAPNPRNSNINLKNMRNKGYNNLYGPGPSSRKHRRYENKKIFKDNIYNENYIVPDENKVFKMFHDYFPPLPSSEFNLSENKSVRAGAPMLVQYDGIGFNMNMIMNQIDSSENERFREEADETYKKILEMYPDVNVRRKRRLRRRT